MSFDPRFCFCACPPSAGESFYCAVSIMIVRCVLLCRADVGVGVGDGE